MIKENKKVIKKCLNCGKEFESYKSSKRKFCCHSCSISYSWKNNRKHAKKTKFICMYCGKEFYLNSCETRVKKNEVHYCSAKCSSNARKTGKIIKCKNCGKEFYSTRNEFCCKECAYQYKVKHYNHKLYEENGYKVRFINGYNKKGDVKEHRYIMEKYLGRKLEKDEVVHHINGNKQDNRIENLQVMTLSEHSSLHRKKEIANGKILFKKLD